MGACNHAVAFPMCGWSSVGVVSLMALIVLMVDSPKTPTNLFLFRSPNNLALFSTY